MMRGKDYILSSRQVWALICQLGTSPKPDLLYPEDKKIRDMYMDGLSIPQVSRALGISASTIARRVQAMGISRPRQKYKIPLDKDDIRRRYENGQCVQHIARDLGANPKTVKRRLEEAGIKFKSGTKRKTERKTER